MDGTTKIIRKYSTTLFANGGARRECWEATSEDGAWLFARIEMPGTPWHVVHVPTNTGLDGLYRTLDQAVRAAIAIDANCSDTPSAQAGTCSSSHPHTRP